MHLHFGVPTNARYLKAKILFIWKTLAFNKSIIYKLYICIMNIIVKTILNTTRFPWKSKFLDLKHKADDNSDNQLDSKELMVACP